MKMLTGEQCAKPYPKSVLSWGVGARGGILHSLHSPPNRIPTCLGFPITLIKTGL